VSACLSVCLFRPFVCVVAHCFSDCGWALTVAAARHWRAHTQLKTVDKRPRHFNATTTHTSRDQPARQTDRQADSSREREREMEDKQAMLVGQQEERNNTQPK